MVRLRGGTDVAAQSKKRGEDVVVLPSSHCVLLDPLFGWDPH